MVGTVSCKSFRYRHLPDIGSALKLLPVLMHDSNCVYQKPASSDALIPVSGGCSHGQMPACLSMTATMCIKSKHASTDAVEADPVIGHMPDVQLVRV